MKAGSFSFVGVGAVLVGIVSAMTPPGLSPANSENMTAFFDTTTLAVNGVNIPKANAASAPTLALDKNLAGTTFAIVMTDPDAGGSGNGSAAFLHWMQDGLTSASTSVTVGNKTVFPLVNAANVSAVAAYVSPGPPAGQTHRYTQYLLATTGITGFSVSTTVAQEVTTRANFDMAAFASQANLTIVSSNFFNVTGT